ncbi:hypothetical protein DRW03_27760 [Corallococcus sp. H22C18031201]|nr:hypothetical protein DRW03_27760 [Corallococcus sp. H22C18031201]
MVVFFAFSLVAVIAIATGADDPLPDDEIEEKIAQASLNPLPPLGGSGQFGVAQASPVALGSLKPSYSNKDLKLSAPFGGATLERHFSGANNAWLEADPAKVLPAPFGHMAATGGRSGASLQWWHNFHSFILLRVHTGSHCSGDPQTPSCEDMTYWDVYGGPAGTKKTFAACELDGCFSQDESEQSMKIQRSGDGFIVYTSAGRYHYRTLRSIYVLKDLAVRSQKMLWEGAYFLSYVEPAQYDASSCPSEGQEDAGVDVAASCHRRSARLSYAIPSSKSPAECSPSEGTAGVLGANLPVLDSVTTASGDKLVFHYQALQARVPALIEGKTQECVLSSVDVVGRSGTVEAGAVQYSYLENKAGLVSGSQWPDRPMTGGGTVPGTMENYAYRDASGQPIWEVTRNGVLVVRQSLMGADGGIAEGYVGQEVSPHDAYAIGVSGNGCVPGMMSLTLTSPCGPNQYQTFTSSQALLGDGTGTAVSSVEHRFLMKLSGWAPRGDQGPVLGKTQVVAQCDGGMCAGLATAGATTAWDMTFLSPVGRTGKVEVAQYQQQPNGSFSVFEHGLATGTDVLSAGFLPPAELNRVYLGATGEDGGSPLLVNQYTYAYGGATRAASQRGFEQLVQSKLSPSALSEEAPGAQAGVFMQYDSFTNQLQGVIRSGLTWEFSDGPHTWERKPRLVGTFYCTSDDCSRSVGAAQDPRGRIRAVMGPCLVESQSSTTCDKAAPSGKPAYTFPLTRYEYWADTSTGQRAGRVSKKRVCTQATSAGCTGTFLDTTYDAYDSRGRLLQSTDPNGIVTTFEYAGERLARFTTAVGTPLEAVTEYGYDNGAHGDYIKHSDGHYEVQCFRLGVAPGADCADSGGAHPRSDLLQWKASSATPGGAVYSERVDYTYRQGKLRSETYRDETGEVRRTRYFEGDPLGRITFEASGTNAPEPSPTSAAIYSQTGLFDAQGNRIGMGLSYQPGASVPPPLCGGIDPNTLASGSPQPLSPQCTAFSYDRLNRLVSLVEPLGTNAPQATAVRTLLSYDPAGNLRSVQQGCPSGAGTCSQPVVNYQHDDFGNVVRVHAPWAMGPQESGSAGPGRGIYQFEYDAAGNLVREQTPAMAAATVMQWLDYEYDSLGRLRGANAVTSSSVESLYRIAYDNEVAAPSACPDSSPSRPSLALGRAQVLTDSFGDSWYQYDAHGNMIGLYRVRKQTGWAARTHPCVGAHTNASPNRVLYYDRTGLLMNEWMPGGRYVSYGYYGNTTGRSHRVKSISATTWDGTSWSGMVTLIDDARWEPFGGLRSYVLNAPGAPASNRQARVEYHRGGSNQPLTNCSGTGFASTGDTSGRLSGLTVSKVEAGGVLGDIFKRAYTWKGDQALQEDTCLLESGSVAPNSVRYADSGSGAQGYDARLQLRFAQQLTSPGMSEGGSYQSRAYEYDTRGNRTSELLDGWQYGSEYDAGAPRVDWLMTRSWTPNACSGGSCPREFKVTQRYGYDADGRVKQVADYKQKTDPIGSPLHVLSLDPSTTGANAAVGAVYRMVSDSEGRSYEYFYDAQGRRRLKRYLLDTPAGMPEDEYFYDGTRLLEDWGHTGFDLSTADSVRDEYLWLDNRPLAFFKSRSSLSGQRSQDLVGDCPRNGEPAKCGLYFIVTDGLGKPVMVLDSYRRVAGVGDYDPYGQVNRTARVASSPVLGTGQDVLFSALKAPASTATVTQMRARLAFIDTASGSGVYLADGSGALVNGVSGASTLLSNLVGTGVATDWAQTSADGTLQLRFKSPTTAGATGEASLEGLEYRRFQSGATPTWTPLRFPGQYHDTETDLFENWNRYYEPRSGRYLGPEPMLLTSEWAAKLRESGRGMPVYQYASGNPVYFVDADGNDVTCEKDNTNDCMVKPDEEGDEIVIEDSSGNVVKTMTITEATKDTPVALKPGEKWVGKQDGVATKDKPGAVFKTTDSVDVSLGKGGKASTSLPYPKEHSFPPGGWFDENMSKYLFRMGGRIARTGWKDQDWIDGKGVGNVPRTDWVPLMDSTKPDPKK